MDSHTFGYIVATAILIVPALAISVRIALGPLIDSMARRRGSIPGELEQRVVALEAQLREVRDENAAVRGEVEALRSAEAFYRDLQLPKAGAPGS